MPRTWRPARNSTPRRRDCLAGDDGSRQAQLLPWPSITAGAVTLAFSRYRKKLGDVIDRFSREEFPSEGVHLESGQGLVVSDEDAEKLIDERAAELVSTVFERLQAEHAVELAQ